LDIVEAPCRACRAAANCECKQSQLQRDDGRARRVRGVGRKARTNKKAAGNINPWVTG
jgi:hypothetical protein